MIILLQICMDAVHLVKQQRESFWLAKRLWLYFALLECEDCANCIGLTIYWKGFGLENFSFSRPSSCTATNVPLSPLSSWTSMKYWLDGPCCLSVSAVGIVANSIAMFVLARQRVQRNFHLLMMFLSFWDFMYLVFSIICFSLPVMNRHYRCVSISSCQAKYVSRSFSETTFTSLWSRMLFLWLKSVCLALASAL